MDLSLSKLREMVNEREAWHAAVHRWQRVRRYWVTEQQQQNMELGRWFHKIEGGSLFCEHIKSPLISGQVAAFDISCIPWPEFQSLLSLEMLLLFSCPVIQSQISLCDSMDCSMPGLPVPHHLLEFAQVRVHCINDAILPSYPLTHSSSALNLSQHQRYPQRKIPADQLSYLCVTLPILWQVSDPRIAFLFSH